MIKGFNINGNIERIDYESLENKPFYSEVVTEINRDIIPLQEIMLASDDVPKGCVGAPLPLSTLSPIVSNALYNFTFDDTTIQVTSSYVEEMLVFGNASLIDMGEDTGEPYVIVFFYDDGDMDSPMAMIIYRTTAGTHTIGLSYIGDIIPLIPEDTYNFELQYDSKDDYYYYDTYWDEIFGLHPQDGDKYKFTFGDTVCEITPVYDDDYEGYLAGNLHMKDEDAEDTGENYFLIMYENFIAIEPLVEGEYTVSLEKVLQSTTVETVHKIDSKYLDINYRKDDEGNGIFDNDIFIDNGNISIKKINENVSILQDEVEYLNSSSKQLVEGLLPDTSYDKTNIGLSANKKAIPLGESAWIEGQASVLQYEWKVTNAKLNVNGPDFYYNVTIDIDFSDDGRAKAIKKKIDASKGNYCVGINFDEDIHTTYYLRFDQADIVGKRVTLSYLSFFSSRDEFSIDDYTSRNIATIYCFAINGTASHAEGIETIATASAAHAEGEETFATGYNSHAEGAGTKASGYNSHAEGAGTKASGGNSHAEGEATHASGYTSHAEGYLTKTTGEHSHAEGSNTIASGNNSHAEGLFTIASGRESHVQGKWNIEDTENKYVHIIGNGSNDSNRSNAHTVDWKGNAWYAGEIYIGGTKQDEGKQLATQEYVMAAINGTLDEIEAMIDESGVLDE